MEDLIKYDMQDILGQLVSQFPDIDALYLFGSRAHATQSLRSDFDVLVRVADQMHIRPMDLRNFAMSKCSALDLFIANAGRAISVMNDSYVSAADFQTLIDKLDAILLWDKAGFKKIPLPWQFEVRNVFFTPSNLPNSSVESYSWEFISRKAESLGLPTDPFIGSSFDRAADFLARMAKGMIRSNSDFRETSKAKNAWPVKLTNEYDCQDLFFTVVKPVITSFGREEVAIYYDEQKKVADFNFFESKVIVEMKFIDSEKKKAEVLKTLDGLERFYLRNSNVEILLMLLFVKSDVEIDVPRIEQDFSKLRTSPKVITNVIKF